MSRAFCPFHRFLPFFSVQPSRLCRHPSLLWLNFRIARPESPPGMSQGSTCPGSCPKLFPEPCVRRLAGKARVPDHEIRKDFDLAGRFHNAHAGYRACNLRQPAGHGEDEISVSNRENRWQKEWKTKRDAPLRAELRQGTIHRSLLTLQRFDQRVRKLQILFQRKTTNASALGGAHETNKVH